MSIFRSFCWRGIYFNNRGIGLAGMSGASTKHEAGLNVKAYSVTSTGELRWDFAFAAVVGIVAEAEARRVDPVSPTAAPVVARVEAQVNTAQDLSNLWWFYNQVRLGQPWDIKQSNVWPETIQTPHPGHVHMPVIYNGRIMTPESLGNYTFGYIGAALGLSPELLMFGSWIADWRSHGDGLATPWGYEERWLNESGDWFEIWQGILSYHRGTSRISANCFD